MTAPIRPLAMLCAAVMLGACSNDQTGTPQPAADPQREVTVSVDAFGPHAPARAFRGETVALTQVIAPAGADGTIDGDVESQTGAALRLLADALEAENLTLADVVQLTVHVVPEPDGQLDIQAVSRAWTRNFGNRLQPAAPARTIVGAAALPGEGARVSLSALAVRPVPAPLTTDPQ